MPSAHTHANYEIELRELQDSLRRMVEQVQSLIRGSVQAVIERDDARAQEMIALDDAIDRLELDIDERCLRILALHHPVASDLRFVTMAMKMVTDLERIGDLGVNISERALELNREPPLKPYLDLPNMTAIVLAMLGGVLASFTERNAVVAERVLALDDVVDAYFEQMMRELLTYMMEDAHNIPRGIRVQSVAKHLERIGDHATNLAEEIVFMIRGVDVRHAR
jgi:phosphate transport system protein